jgi:hypothetical protein
MLTYLFPDHNGTRQVFAVNLPVSLALAGSAVADKKDTSLSSSSASVSVTTYPDIEIGKKKRKLEIT